MEKKFKQQMQKLIQEDHIGNPKQGVEDRLMYTFMLKNGTSELRQNSFAGFTGWLFSLKSIGIKTAILACLFVFMLMNTNLHQDNHYSSCCDSTFVQKVLVPDSANFSSGISTEKKDTVF